MPEIQLNFPNPLNVSVQIGDVAYFSNPTPVGLEQSWTATTTPHMSNAQDGIIKIGEILSIIPWDGFVSSIICDMPQNLYNQYYAQITAGGCTLVPSGNPPITSGDCSNFEAVFDWPVIDATNPQPGNQVGYSWVNSPSNPMNWVFDNPTRDISEVMFHVAMPGAVQSNDCEVAVGGKSVNGVDDRIAGARNVWVQWGRIDLGVVNCTGGVSPYPQQFPLNYPNGVVPTPAGMTDACNMTSFSPTHDLSANSIIDKYNELYPGGNYPYGVSWPSFIAHHENYMNNTFIPSIWTSSNPINFTYEMYFYLINYFPLSGSYIDEFIQNCIQGSFIMFSKDNKANMSDMLGYYASIELRNSSKTEAELFNVGTTFFESSK